jgi:UDP-N-acetylglucosamine--N-acetylmuramyl-(pentapeptide) pyrophosphoryl-undecaprenol N-acetylglucosamine transferase
LALAEHLHAACPDWEFIFVGTKSGPEKSLVAELSWPVEYLSLASGKWRRYLSLANFFDIFKISQAFFSSRRLLRRWPADLVVSAGSFVSVPLVWAAATKKTPILIHQQDYRPGLANRLMAPFARAITVTFEKSLLDYGPKAIWIGNPVSATAVDTAERLVEATRRQYNLCPGRPLVLVIGGGTGAAAINRLLDQARQELAGFCQVIHLTGRGKAAKSQILAADGQAAADWNKQENSVSADFYQAYEFLDNSEILKLMAAADLVISRGGLGALTELAALAKPALIIPIPGSHQEDNAAIFEKSGAVFVLNQINLSAASLVVTVRGLLQDESRLGRLSANISKAMKRGAVDSLAAVVQEIVAPTIRSDRKN